MGREPQVLIARGLTSSPYRGNGGLGLAHVCTLEGRRFIRTGWECAVSTGAAFGTIKCRNSCPEPMQKIRRKTW